MTQHEIEQKARESFPTRLNNPKNSYHLVEVRAAYIAGYNASSLDSQNQIDKLVECLRELGEIAEQWPTGYLIPDELQKIDKARTLLATFTDKKLEDETR